MDEGVFQATRTLKINGQSKTANGQTNGARQWEINNA
jgi:hypothetical protein